MVVSGNYAYLADAGLQIIRLGAPITDGEGNAATLALPSPEAAGSLGANKDLVIETCGLTYDLPAGNNNLRRGLTGGQFGLVCGRYVYTRPCPLYSGLEFTFILGCG